jgi:hypothetical protein
MKIKLHYRTGGLEHKKIGREGDILVLPASFKGVVKEIEANTVEELFAQYPPLKISDNLIKAVQELLDGKRESLTYNFGKGNAKFYTE